MRPARSRTVASSAALRLADADPDHRHLGAQRLDGDQQARLGAAAPRGVQDRIDRLAQGVRLGQQLEAGCDVAERPDRRRAADRDHERALAARAQAGRDPREFGLEVGAALDEMQPSTPEAIEQDVAAPLIVGVVAGDPALEDQRAAEPVAGGRGRGLAAVVRLHPARGDQDVGALLDRLAEQELELAGLVAAEREAGRVVALDQDVRAAEPRRQPGQRLERGRQVAEAGAGEAGELH